MEEDGYDSAFSAAVTAASCTIGPLIPPSIAMVLYGVIAEVSIGQLFLAGAVPGLVLGFGFMLTLRLMKKVKLIGCGSSEGASQRCVGGQLSR
jgi:TRAP-type C4-dicarboxylate transport system permease large subunit